MNNAEALHAFLTIVPELVEIRSNLDGRTNRAKDFDTLLTKARELRDLSDRYFAQWREMEIVKR
ncbi:hypothetical protein WT12_08555 [Burkholderia territorii]|nr:hypothetical protein WT12_08555 [Burkholderia territorii]